MSVSESFELVYLKTADGFETVGKVRKVGGVVRILEGSKKVKGFYTDEKGNRVVRLCICPHVRRKSVSISVSVDLVASLRVPKRFNLQSAVGFVELQSGWIVKKLEKFEASSGKKPSSLSYVTGDVLRFLGFGVSLVVHEGELFSSVVCGFKFADGNVLAAEQFADGVLSEGESCDEVVSGDGLNVVGGGVLCGLRSWFGGVRSGFQGVGSAEAGAKRVSSAVGAGDGATASVSSVAPVRALEGGGGVMEVCCKDCGEVRDLVRDWFLGQSKRILEKRLDYCYGVFASVYPCMRKPKLRVSFMKSRWGSMSTSRRMSLNCYLVYFSLDLVDYVIFHELSHMIEMNHSGRFYEVQSRFVPEWKEKRMRMKGCFDFITRL